MENIGSEIGQKMRSAVKAKLLEMGTGGSAGYIDDELPDYVMIMVANKRSKQQMTADLNLFLGEQTDLFVTWLHEVLQKLQEVTLPAGSVPAKKRKTSQKDDTSTKKDKKSNKKEKKTTKKATEDNIPLTEAPGDVAAGDPKQPNISSITDVFAEEFLQKAKQTLTENTETAANIKKGKTRIASTEAVVATPQPAGETNTFDIPTISEITSSPEPEGTGTGGNREKDLAELAEIQRKIYEAKRHLKELGELDDEMESDDCDYLNLKDDGSAEEFNEAGDLVKKPPKPAAVSKKSPIRFDIPEKDNHETKSNEASKQNSQQRQAKESPVKAPISKPDPIDSNQRHIQDENKKQDNIAYLRRSRERERREPPAESPRKRPIHERLGLKQLTRETSRDHRTRQSKELYVPAFRRRELDQEGDRGRERERGHDLRSQRDRDGKREREPAPKSSERGKRNNRPVSEAAHTNDNLASDDAEIIETSPKRNQRIGSRVIVAPAKPIESSDDNSLQDKPVNSVIKIKPRTPVSPSKQACKNLLLRAVAEAQRSTILTQATKKDSKSQSIKVMDRKTKLYTKAYRNRPSSGAPGMLFRRTTQNLVIEVEGAKEGKTHRKLIQQVHPIEIEEEEYVPELPLNRYKANYEYVPSSIQNENSGDQSGYDNYDDGIECSQEHKITSNTQFVVTLNDEKVPVNYGSCINRSLSRSPSIDAHSNNSPTVVHQHNGVKSLSTFQRTNSRSRMARQQLNSSQNVEKPINVAATTTAKRQSERETSCYTPPKARRSDVKDVYRKPKEIKKIIINNNDSDDEELNHKKVQQNNHKQLTEPSTGNHNKETEVRSSTPPLPLALKRSIVDNKNTDAFASPSHTPSKRKRTPIKFDMEKDNSKPLKDDRGSITKRRSKSGEKDRDSSLERHDGEDRRKISIRTAEAKKYENIPALSSVALDSSAMKVVKPRERCKYHPNCTKQFCEYYHPTAPCKSFPNCKYADKCMYSHPKCKYDMACTSLDCNFSHSGVRNPSLLQPTAPPLSSHVVPVQNYKSISVAPTATTSMCKYYPNCTKVGCTFYHPKPCRFGKNCINKLECNFYHHETQSSSKFKWVASMV